MLAYGLTIVDLLAEYTGLLRRMRHDCSSGITILMYHKILPKQNIPEYPLQNLVVDTIAFNRQSAWLAKHFEVLPVREALANLDWGIEKRPRSSRPLACITFDDGYRDNFDHAAPILDAHGLRATFFVTTGFVEGAPLWFDSAALAWMRDCSAVVQIARISAPEFCGDLTKTSSLDTWLSTLKRMPTRSRLAVMDEIGIVANAPTHIFGAMTPDQIRRLADHGHEIGAHSVTHPILTDLDDASLRKELEQSRSMVHDWTRQQVDGLCYPNGNHEERTIIAARKAGFDYGIGVRRGIVNHGSNRMALPRRAILSSNRRQSNSARFASEVVGWHDLLRDFMKSRLKGGRKNTA